MELNNAECLVLERYLYLDGMSVVYVTCMYIFFFLRTLRALGSYWAKDVWEANENNEKNEK